MPSRVTDELKTLTDNVIGRHELISTPFGGRVLCYADFTASGRSLHCVEDFITRNVLPLYGNTHTTVSATGSQTTQFREEARRIIAKSVNANSSGAGGEDTVLFAGPGTTSAVIKLVTALGLHVPQPAGTDASQRPVVFVGPFEHRSNLLPWRESVAQVVVIPENGRGQVDVDVLKQKLQQYNSRPLKIGAFSAASNLTDVCSATSISSPQRAHARSAGILGLCELRADAVYFSGHKFIGGPGSPGVLVVKKRLLGNAVPTTPGGGTVFFVTERDHRYLSNREEREEGGTPDILGSIRLGLAFEVKQRIGTHHIMELEHKHVARVRSSLAVNDKIVLLGRHDGADLDQLPIFSFLIRCGDRFLHYNFVCALLNDLFGIQTRGGCQCAGPYATRLLGLSKRDLLHIEVHLLNDVEVLRPGSSRVSFPYFMPEDEVDFILQAIHFVADEGWKFLPQYTFNIATGLWSFSSTASHSQRDSKRLAAFSLTQPREELPENASPRLDIEWQRQKSLESAKALASACVSSIQFAPLADDGSWESLRWFTYPSEAAAALNAGTAPIITRKPVGPFQPHRYVEGTLLRQWETHSFRDHIGREPSGKYPLRRDDEELQPADASPNDQRTHAAEELRMKSRWSRIRAAFRRRRSRQQPAMLMRTAPTKELHGEEVPLCRCVRAHVA